MARSSHRYKPKEISEEEKRLVVRLHELTRRYPRIGYRMMTARLQQEGWHVNRKRVHRLLRKEGLKVPRKTRKKQSLGHSDNSCTRRRAEHPNHIWCWDFIHDRTIFGKPLKWLAITDEYTRECLALEVDSSITADKVVDVLVDLFITRGSPMHIRSDNGPEFIADAISKHAERTGLQMLYVEPGSPWENGFAESFFSRLRDELLNCEEFTDLAEARWFADRRKDEHNNDRPHSSLNYQTPSAFAAVCAASSAPAAPALRTRHKRDPEPLTLTQPILS